MKHAYRFLTILILAALILGCSNANPVASTSVSPVGASSAIPSISPPIPTSIPLYVLDPTQGLGTLPAYRATFTLSFDGTQVNKPSQWSQTYTLSIDTGSKSRLLLYSETGLDPNAAAYPALFGAMDNVRYLKNNPSDTCVASFDETPYDPTALPELASMLPKLKQMSGPVATETIGSILTEPHSYDASAVTDLKSTQATGKVWLAVDGNYVVKYSLQIKGSKDFFDQDTEGTMTWEYQLETLNPADGALLPADCPLPLPDVPMTDDAANILKFPGILRYETAEDIQTVANFYLNSLPGAGFTQIGDGRIGSVNASLSFSKGGQIIDILVENGTPTTVSITIESAISANPSDVSTPAASAPTDTAGNPQMRVAGSQNLLLGTTDTPSVFASYHLEYLNLSPKWSNDAVTQSNYTLSADVQGSNVHFTENSDGSINEVILIGDQEYEVKNGTVTPGMGLAGLSWSVWPIDSIVVLSIGSFKTEPAGNDTIEGHPVEIYTLTGSINDDPTGMLASFGTGVTAVYGKVWIDQATGGLIRMVVDYESDVKDSSGSVVGHGTGHLELNVTQIGSVTVTPPK